MKRIAVPILVVTALAAVAALAAVPASAATVLCNESTTTCPAANTYPGGTSIEAKLKAETSVKFKGSFSSTCSQSTLAGKSTAEVGESVPVEITGLTISCSSPCKAVEAKNLPYSSQAAKTEGGNGTLTVNSSESGTPAITFSECSWGTSCTFSLSNMALAANGGNPAQLVANEVPLSLTEGMSFFCGKTIKFNATYEVTAPKPMFLTGGEGRNYVLCKENALLCPAASVLPAGTEINATATNPIISFGFSEKCNSSGMSMTTSEESGKPLNAQITSLTFSGACTPCTKATAKFLPYSASFTPTSGGNGTMTTSFEIQWSGCTGGAECTFEFSNAHLEVKGGSPVVLFANELEGGLGGGNPNLCGHTMKLTATWNVSSPSAFWVTRGT